MLYFALLLYVFMPHGLQTELTGKTGCVSAEGAFISGCYIPPLTPLATNADIIAVFQQADPAFLARHVKEIVETKNWQHVSSWPLWPPGMIALETFLYWISPATPVALILIVLNTFLWAAVLTQLHIRIKGAQPQKIYLLFLPLFFILLEEFSYFTHTGIFYSESLSIAFFLLGAGSLIKALHTHQRRSAFLAGAGFTCSAYMRAQTDIIMTMLLLLLVFSIIAGTLWKRCFPNARFMHWKGLAMLGFSLLSYHLLTFPYRFAHDMHWIGFFENPMWHAVWEKKENLTDILRFYEEGGGLAGCVIDPDLCNQIHFRQEIGHEHFTNRDYFSFALQSFFHYPLCWLIFKGSYLAKFWFNNAAESLLVTLSGVYYMIRGLYGADNDTQKLLAFLIIATALGVLAPLLLIHIEPRYLYQIKLLLFYALLLLCSREPFVNPKIFTNLKE